VPQNSTYIFAAFFIKKNKKYMSLVIVLAVRIERTLNLLNVVTFVVGEALSDI